MPDRGTRITPQSSVWEFRPSEPICFHLGKQIKVVYAVVKP